MSGKKRNLEIDFLNYKIEALEKRIEILESARESLDKELLAILLHHVKARENHIDHDNHENDKVNRTDEKKKTCSNDDKNKGKLIDDESDQKFDRLLQFSRRRIIL